MKKLIIPFLLIAALAAGCSNGSKDPSSSAPETPSSSISQPEPDTSSEAPEAKNVYENEALGIKFQLPASIADKYEAVASEEKQGEEAVNVLTFSMKGEEKNTAVFTVKTMSKKAYEALKAKGGEMTELAANDTKAAVLEAVKANPFKEGTAESDTFAALTKELAAIKDTFELK